MERLRAWLRRFDRLIVQPGLWLPGSETVAITLQRGWVRVAMFAVATVAAGFLGAAVINDWPLGPLPLVAVLISVGSNASGRRATQLRNPALAQAAAWAAVTLGKKSGEKWVIKGVTAGEVLDELARLQHSADELWNAGERDARDIERYLLAAAKPMLAPYLRPVLTATPELEPREVDAVAHRDGDPWPMLERADEDWPVLWDRDKSSG